MPNPGDVQSFDRYAYVNNNPLKYTDPTGHNGIAIHDSNDGVLPNWALWGQFYDEDPSLLDAEILAWLQDHQNIYEIEAMQQLLSSYYQDFGTGVLDAFNHVYANAFVGGELPTLWGDEAGNNGYAAILAGTINSGLAMGSDDNATPNSYLARLPIRRGGKGKTSGILIINRQEYNLISGKAGPAQNIPLGTPGFNGITKTHVEGHASAIMRQTGATRATLYINNAPCPGLRGCDALLSRMLPEGAELTVFAPNGFYKVYVGLPD